jgi:hypothetical protein
MRFGITACERLTFRKKVALAMHWMEVRMIFCMKKVTHRVKTTMKMILVAVTTIFWASITLRLLILVCNNPVFFQ